jgi:hypothetical protein
MATTKQYKLVAKNEDFSNPLDGYCTSGDVIGLEASSIPTANHEYVWSVEGGSILELPDAQRIDPTVHWDTSSTSGIKKATVKFHDPANPATPVGEASVTINIRQSPVVQQVDSLKVSMRRANTIQTDDQALWSAIRNRTKAIRFSGSGYNDFINKVLGKNDTSNIDSSQNSRALKRQRDELFTPIQGVGAYDLLKTATQVFLLMESGVVIQGQDRYTGEALFQPLEENSRLGRSISLKQAQDQLGNYLGGGNLPYLNRILRNAFSDLTKGGGVFDGEFLVSRVNNPSMLELIFSYWMEEGMLVQTINAICMRFQNRRVGSKKDPLAYMEIAPLYPINNLLWGYIQDEINRLSVQRRAYSYNYQYGLTLYGKAVPDFNPADTRSKFLEAFHNLLFAAATFYKRDDDTTVVADGFPLLNALKEVHLILSEGAHNQFGDLPWTARSEMLMQQYILARPEMRKFLQSREMVPYKEGWMAQVDTMKSIQGWTDVSITHFHNLAEFGEQLLLSIRYGDWINVEDANQASNWARYWRPEIQGYNHAYRACTGVDLVTDTRDSQQLALLSTQPGLLLRQRSLEGNGRLLAPVENLQTNGFRSRRQQPTPRQLP